MERIGKVLQQKKDKPRHIRYEFQDYGYRLAQDLNDLKHKSLYIKLAKEKKREFLEKARIFASDYSGAKSKAKVFMWKLRELQVSG